MKFPNHYKILKTSQYESGNIKIVPIRYEDRLLIMHWRNEQMYHLRQQKVLTETDQNQYFDTIVSKLFDANQPNQLLFSCGEDVWIHSENIFWKSVIKDMKRSDFLIVNSSFIKKWAKTIIDEKKIKVAELGVSSCFLNP